MYNALKEFDMNRLYIITDSDGNIVYSLDTEKWTPVNEKTNVVTLYEKFCWFSLTLQVRKILHCVQRNKSKGVVKLKQYIQQHIKL